MARLVERTIKKPLSELLLFGDVQDGDRVVVDVHDGSLQVKPGNPEGVTSTGHGLDFHADKM